jgi:uncharacterized damage-inducible protein DinB
MSRAIDKTILLQDLEQQVERHLAEAVKAYQNWMPERLLQKPVNGGWSVAECLWHLNSYGSHYLPRIEKGLAAPTTADPLFRSSWLGSWFTNLMKPGPGMTKMSAFKNHVPPSALNPYEVVAEFIQQQEVLLALLRRARAADLNRIRIGLSIMPWLKMKLGDVFQFLVTHQERHMVQAANVATGIREREPQSNVA